MSSKKMQTSESFAGLRSSYQPLQAKDKLVFKEATREIIDIEYRPYAVAVRLGVNYYFKCLALVPHSPIMWEITLYVSKPLDGSAYIVGSDRVINTKASE